MKKIILKILVFILKVMYVPFKLLKVRNKIVYISRQSNNENIDFQLIREEIEKEYPEYKNIVLTKKIEDSLFSKVAYCGNVFKQMYHLATSKIVIIDTYCITACVLSHKKQTTVVQIWHAIRSYKKVWLSDNRKKNWYKFRDSQDNVYAQKLQLCFSTK